MTLIMGHDPSPDMSANQVREYCQDKVSKQDLADAYTSSLAAVHE